MSSRTGQEPNPVGRPSKYETRYCEELIDDGKLGYSLTAFAGKIGVARSTINEWIGAHCEFSEAVKTHQAARTRFLETGLLEGEVGARVTSRIFALKNADPDGWKDKHEVEHSGNVGIREWLTEAS